MFCFCKMQATGNDFVLIDYTKRKFNYSFKLLAEFLCNRHFGVGADGIIVIDTSDIADFKMRIFNKDGSEAEMCGNGIRCLGKYVYEHSLTKKEKITVETLSGIKNLELNIEGKTVVSVKVDMGKPIFEYNKIPIIDFFKIAEWKDGIEIDGRTFYLVSLGNPHAVCFVENVDDVNIKKIGSKVEYYKIFPNKTNVEFVEVENESRIKVRIWERGVGETLSCGTGSIASAIVANIIKSTKSELIVDLKGGNLRVNYDKEKVYLEGEAQEIFYGYLKI